MTTTSLADIAYQYRKLGWAPLPMKPQSGKLKDKLPYIKWKAYQTTSPSEEDIHQWWKRWPFADIGIITGKISNLLSLDFDSEEALKTFQYEVGDLSDTLIFESRPGHCQYLFTYPSKDVYNIVGLIPGVDVRGSGGLIVAPPSRHWSGSSYTWIKINPLIEGNLENLCDLPDEIFQFICSYQKNKNRKSSAFTKKNNGDSGIMPSWMKDVIGGVEEGNRNESATKICGWYVWKFFGDKMLTETAMNDWNKKNKPPLSAQELNKIIHSVLSRHKVDSKVIKQYEVIIDKAIFHKAPDGESRFEFFIKGIPDNSLFLTAADIISNLKFRQKIAGFTGVLMDAMNNKTFIPYIKSILEKSEVKNIDTEITHEGLVAETIAIQIKTPGKELKHLEDTVIIQNETIYLKISTVKKHINEKIEGILSRFDILKALTGIGFTKIRVWEEGKQYRVWSIKMNMFENYFRRGEIEEIFE